MLAWRPSAIGFDGHHQTSRSDKAQRCLLDAVLHIRLGQRIEPAEGVKNGGGNEVVPRSEAKVAVYEEKDEENGGGDKMRGFKELVIPITGAFQSLERNLGDMVKGKPTVSGVST